MRSPDFGVYIGRSRSVTGEQQRPGAQRARGGQRRPEDSLGPGAGPHRAADADDERRGASAQRGIEAESDLPDELVGAVGGERVHERAGADVAVGPRDRVAVEEPGAARERERAVDHAGGGLVDERLDRLRLGEQRSELLARAVGVGMRRLVLVDQRRRRGPKPPGRRRAPWRSRRRASGPRVLAPPRGRRRGDGWCAASAMPSEAEAWNSPTTRLRSM